MQRFIKMFLVLTFLAFSVTAAQAKSSYLSSFESTYPAAGGSAIDDCTLCHSSMSSYARNSFGSAYAGAGHNFASIASVDSDGDGFSNLAEITAMTFPGDSSSKPATPPPPATCSSFTYSAWGACQSNNTQTRTVASSSPAGCTGGTPVTSQSCTYVPPVTTCSSFTYSAWGTCQSNNTQTRTVASSSPAGCTGGTPVTSQSCTYVPPPPAACSYTYSAWAACQSSNTQTRTVTSTTPAGCTGTPLTSQSCTYVPPVTPPPTGTMPLPAGQMIYTYDAVAVPVLSADPSKAKPIGVGPIANGGTSVSVNVNVGPFAGTVNISLAEYKPSYRTNTVFSMNSEGRLVPSYSGNVGVWKADVTGVKKHVFGPIPVSNLKKGIYTLTLTAKPSGSRDEADDDDDDEGSSSSSSYYKWTTHFTVR